MKTHEVITFGVSEIDMDLLKDKPIPDHLNKFLNAEKFNIVYVGVCGNYMKESIERFLFSIKLGLEKDPEIFESLNISFIGTSYAPKSLAKELVYPIALELGLKDLVYEQTDRIPYYEAIQLVNKANALFIPGSDEPGYTASKLYHYLLAQKPLIAIFNPLSSVNKIIEECTDIKPFSLDENRNDQLERLYSLIKNWLISPPLTPKLNMVSFSKYTALEMARRQSIFFDKTLKSVRF